MANEILKRNPTSTGNRRVFTWAGWVKINQPSSATNCIWYVASAGNSEFNISIGSGAINVYDYAPGGYQYQYITSRLLRDFSNWFHLVVAVDTTQFREDDRFKIYINGVLYNGIYSTEVTVGGINYNTRMNTPGEINYIGQNVVGGSTYSANCELTDLFMIDGQALTADVFGFNKVGKGYISVGSTQSTDFRPGQWVPKTPRVIKTVINNNGGFGVNGFYLPMNDSNNFGADFHCDPNSIITLNEKLPQPRVGVASTASVGIGFTDALRSDPYAANLVLALPFVSGGLNSGFGDYSAAIKGSGSAKTLVWNSGSVTPSIGNTGVYYGSGGNFPGGTVGVSTSADFKMDGSFTVESWFFSNSFNSGNGNHIVQYRNGLAGSDNWVLSQGATGSIRFLLRNDNGTNAADLDITNTGITTNQWYHFVGVYNDTNKTSTVYLNGVTIGIATNISWTRNNGTTLLIGSNSSGPTGAVGDRNINGYLQDLRIYKGVAKYTGGFDVPRPYTPVGIATWRAVPDTTANNFCTWNAVDKGGSLVLTDGNSSITNGSSYSGVRGTIGIPATGKWYFEHREQSTAGSNVIGSLGISTNNHTITGNAAYDNFCGWYWGSAGKQIYINGSNPSSSWMTGYIGSGSILQVAYDADSKKIWFGQDGTYYRWVSGTTLTGDGNPSNGTNQSGIVTSNFNLLPYNNAYATTSQTNFGQNPTFSGNVSVAGTFTDTNGKGLFKYQPPSGFLALCEDNLPTPAIANPGRHFRTVLYTGDGNSGRSIVGVGFTSDLVWIKCRNTARVHGLWDSVRGASNYLVSSSTAVETSDTTNGLQSFNSDGFSIGSVGTFNTSTDTYVAWCWKAGAGTTSTNTNGSITSVVSVNQDAGFSIVSYTGNGGSSAVTIGHGLGKVPSLIICKGRNFTSNWITWHKSLNGGNVGG